MEEKKMINLKINGISVSAPQGSTILDACKLADIKVPTLCYLKEINQIGACRMCLVEVIGNRNLVASCVFPASDGMEVLTHSKRVIDSRRCTLELLLSNHNQDCLNCGRSLNCELQSLAKEYNCDAHKYDGEKTDTNKDESSPSYIRDNSKCIMCKRCTSVCQLRQAVSVIGTNGRGFKSHIGYAYDKPIAESACVNCGQCVNVCPTGALQEKSCVNEVMNAIFDSSKRVIVACAPATRVAVGEMFGMKPGINVEKKMVTAFKRLGFDDVFDIDFGADLTIMEEGAEFIERFTQNKNLPLLTSCSPGWVKFVEEYYPEFIPNLSTSKSPQQMFGAIMKTFYAQKLNMKPEDLYVVSIMPCIAKKYERLRDNENAAGVPDVDAVMTVRELGNFIKQAGIDFANLEDSDFDIPFGYSTGAGVIFGTTGGVMEAALRTVAEKVENKSLDNVDYLIVRGLKGTKEATVKVAGKDVRLAIVSGLANATILLNKIKAGEVSYDFVEVMACPGGCVNGGGMPIYPADIDKNADIVAMRAKGLYNTDVNNKMRKSHENPYIIDLYKNFLGKPGSEKAHHILHTSYVNRKNR